MTVRRTPRDGQSSRAHTAYRQRNCETWLAMTRTAVDDVLAVLAGRRPKFPVPGTLVPF
jgi:hypothetical protein